MATVDFSGNLGGISHYGRGAYGRGSYSRVWPFTPIFAADIDLVGTAYFFGDLSPSVTFAGAFGFDFLLGGDLAPQVTFAADLSVDVSLAGDLSPQVTLEGLLGVDLSLNSIDGSFGFTVVLGASSMISGPLWGVTEPCPPTMWEPTEPCNPVEWEESALCNG